MNTAEKLLLDGFKAGQGYNFIALDKAIASFEPDCDQAFSQAKDLLISYRLILLGKYIDCFHHLMRTLDIELTRSSPLYSAVIAIILGWNYFLFGAINTSMKWIQFCDAICEENGFEIIRSTNRNSYIACNESEQTDPHKYEQWLEAIEQDRKNNFEILEATGINNLVLFSIPYKPFDELEKIHQKIYKSYPPELWYLEIGVNDTYYQLLEFNNKTDKALAISKKIIDLIPPGYENYPMLIEVFLNYAKVNLKANNIEIAEQYFNKAIELSLDNNVLAFLPLLYRYLGETYIRSGKDDLAVDNFLLYHLMNTLKKAQDTISFTFDPMIFETTTEKQFEIILRDQIFNDPDTGFLSRNQFLTLSPQYITDHSDQPLFTAIFRISDSQVLAPERSKKILDNLSKVIITSFSGVGLKTRFSRNELLVVFPSEDEITATQTVDETRRLFFQISDGDNEPWIHLILDIGLIRYKAPERLIETVNRLELSILRGAPMLGGQIKIF